jgi:ATP-dependent Clp protease adaptor protein ClpS
MEEDRMSTDVSLAEESPPAVETVPASEKRSRTERAGAKPKKQPPYAVVVLNDEEHTFQYVIETLMKVFGYPQEKSYTLTLQVHNEGRAIVWSGTREVAELKRDQIRSAGPDFYAEKKVDFPLGVTIEPLPG